MMELRIDAAATSTAPVPEHRGFHNHVVLLRTDHVTVVNFGVMAALGAAAAGWLTLARLCQFGLAPERYVVVLFVVVPVMVLVGSRALVLIQEWRSFLQAPLRTLRRPGFAFQGGFVGVIAGLLGIVWAYDLPLLSFLDAFALSLPLGHAIGRLGCLCYGCCHGRPYRGPLSIRYTNPESKVVWGSGMGGVPLHPTQAYSAAGNLLLFVVLGAIATFDVLPGQISAAYLILGQSGRFGVEFFRGIPVRRVFGLSTYQLVALGLVLCGCVMLYSASTTGSAIHAEFGCLEGMAAAIPHLPFVAGISAALLLALGVHGRRVGHL